MVPHVGNHAVIQVWSFTCIQPHLFKTTNKGMSPTSLIANIQVWIIIGSCMHYKTTQGSFTTMTIGTK